MAAHGSSKAKHLSECKAISLSEIYDGEPKPDDISDYAWSEVLIQKCVGGCPVGEGVRQRALAHAREEGWLREDGTWNWEKD